MDEILNSAFLAVQKSWLSDKTSEKLGICLTWSLNDPTTLAWKANQRCYKEGRWKIWESILFHNGRSEKKLILKYELVVLLYCKHLYPETSFSCSQCKRTLPMCAGLTLEKCLELLEKAGMKHFPLEKGKLLKQRLFKNRLLSKTFWFLKEKYWHCQKDFGWTFFLIQSFHF